MVKEMTKHSPKLVQFVPKQDNRKHKANTVVVVTGGDDRYKGLHTLAQAGQQRLGGYSVEGFKFYTKWRKLIKHARNEPAAKDVEEKALQKVRGDYSITANSYKELCKGQGQKVKSAPIVDNTADAIDLYGSDTD